jgi:hypothetical protein
MTNEQAKPTIPKGVEDAAEYVHQFHMSLYADAGTTYYRTGMFPSKLAELVVELREALEDVAQHACNGIDKDLGKGNYDRILLCASTALAKAQAVKPTTDDKA